MRKERLVAVNTVFIVFKLGCFKDLCIAVIPSIRNMSQNGEKLGSGCLFCSGKI